MPPRLDDILDSGDPAIYSVATSASARPGRLPLPDDFLRNAPGGDIFSYIQGAGMGWDLEKLPGKRYVILGSQGGIRAPDGSPIALGFHAGHFEVGLLMQEAARELRELDCVPIAGFCTDPCDGLTQGTPGMMDSLAYRNDAATIFRRLIRSYPMRSGVLGAATCDKSVPAMMMALASMHDLPCVFIPGGVTLPPEDGEDLGKIQSIGARFAQGEVTLEYAQEMTCRACASAGGGCHFLGTAGTGQVVAEALGLTVPHAALAPSGEEIWRDIARRSARAVLAMESRGLAMTNILSDASVQNAMVTFAAFGGSTNLILHLPAIAYAAGLRRPALEDWVDINRKVPRLVDVIPNGPHPTVRAYMAGGVPEVMLHLRRLDLLQLDALTVTGEPLGSILDWWEDSERRRRLRAILKERDGIDPDDVIMSPDGARDRGLTSTMTFPRGNITPEGSIIKSTAIDPTVVDCDGVYRMTGPARVFVSEADAMRAVKDGAVKPGDVMILCCVGPMGSGMEETFQVTNALKHISWGKHVAIVTDGRFSGVSTGACIGHVSPEALAGGPIGKLLDGDVIRVVIDRNRLEGSVDLIGDADTPPDERSIERGDQLLAERRPRLDLTPQRGFPDDTRLWAALQQTGGGTWGGCVFDVDEIVRRIGSDNAPVK